MIDGQLCKTLTFMPSHASVGVAAHLHTHCASALPNMLLLPLLHFLLLLLLLHCSEKKLRRLEVANGSPRLARLPLFRLLSHSEGRWADEVARAGGAAGERGPGWCLARLADSGWLCVCSWAREVARAGGATGEAAVMVCWLLARVWRLAELCN